MKKFLIALQFLTIFPVKLEDIKEKELPGSVNYYPLVGLGIGLLLAGTGLLFNNIFPAAVSAVLLIGLYLLLTGALHIDGFIDTIDGLYGGSKKEEIFRIMAESTIGAKGAAWLVILLAVKTALLTVLLIRGAYPGIILFPVLGRYVITILMKYSVYAKKNGLGRAFCGKITNTGFVLLNLFTFALVLGFGLKGFAAFLAVILIAIFVKNYFSKKIGGVTGDVFGFAVETAETAVLLLFAAGY